MIQRNDGVFMRSVKWAVLLMSILPAIAQAWWNPEWAMRKKISFNAVQAGVSLSADNLKSPLLIRLHTGNFNFLSNVKLDGSDLRFVAADDKTPLKFHIEKFDPVNEMALVWVSVPTLGSTPETDHIWMYFGNEAVGPGESRAESYASTQMAVFHFSEADAMPRDFTANNNHVTEFTATLNRGSLIGAGAAFAGAQKMVVPASPSLKITPATGFSASFWVKINAPQVAPASVWEISGGVSAAVPSAPPAPTDSVDAAATTSAQITPTPGSSFGVWVDQTNAFIRLNQTGVISETPRSAALLPNTWHHLVVTVSDQIRLYVDGQEAGVIPAPTQEIAGPVTVGASSLGADFFVGELDELRFSGAAVALDAIQLAAKTEGSDAGLLNYAPDESPDSASGSYFGVILQNVTLDGWVVIVMLVVMAFVSWFVMFAKTLLIKRMVSDNRQFLELFQGLSAANPGALDQADDVKHEEGGVLAGLWGKHDDFKNSSLYRIYHAGIQELKHRLGDPRNLATISRNGLSPQALQVVKASLDAATVRETQRLNSLMVLLTIAISGGPFLGLLGTVVGVMITFAAIAASGDVNINAIAPGIAAALVATVAGLAVAIPALFGYNYFTIKIKDIVADMHVFVDELISKLAERYAQ
jgi:biopolymer transport protein ExbB